jgi:hypothetical protein
MLDKCISEEWAQILSRVVDLKKINGAERNALRTTRQTSATTKKDDTSPKAYVGYDAISQTVIE